MVQIIQGLPKPLTGLEMMLSGLGQGLSSGFDKKMKEKEDVDKQYKALSNLGKMLGMKEEQIETFAKLPPAIAQDFAKEQFKQQRQSAMMQSIFGAPEASQNAINPEQIDNNQILAVAQVNPQMAKLIQDQKKESGRSEIEALKYNKPYREKVREDYKNYQDTITHIDRMEKLNESDKLTPSGIVNILDIFGGCSGIKIPLTVLNNPDSEEYAKLVQDLTKNIRSYYGARISNLELENFLKTLPTLQNTQEGRRRIMKNMRVMLAPKQIEYETLNEVRKEYRGKKLPLDIDEIVNERMQPKLDKLAKDFASGTNTKVPEGKITVVSPDGKAYLLPIDKAEEAVKAGWTVK